MKKLFAAKIFRGLPPLFSIAPGAPIPPSFPREGPKQATTKAFKDLLNMLRGSVESTAGPDGSKDSEASTPSCYMPVGRADHTVVVHSVSMRTFPVYPRFPGWLSIPIEVVAGDSPVRNPVQSLTQQCALAWQRYVWLGKVAGRSTNNTLAHIVGVCNTVSKNLRVSESWQSPLQPSRVAQGETPAFSLSPLLVYIRVLFNKFSKKAFDRSLDCVTRSVASIGTVKPGNYLGHVFHLLHAGDLKNNRVRFAEDTSKLERYSNNTFGHPVSVKGFRGGGVNA